MLRRLSVIAFPLLLAAVVVVLFTLPIHWPKAGEMGLSLSGLALIVGANLGITADLPTFFRHSKSLSTSITALTWIQLISLVLALGGLFLGSVITDSFTLNETTILEIHTEILKIALGILVFLSVICANVANVYSASVGWEVLAPSSLVGRKEYLILGLCLTTVFILISGLFSINFMLELSDGALINLAIVLLFGYFISRLQKRLPDVFEQKVYFIAWLVASILNGIQCCVGIGKEFSPLLVGFISVVLVLFFSLGTRFVRAR